MKLALVSPLPPLASPASDLVDRLVALLNEDAELRLLPHAPEQVDRAYESEYAIEPQSKLPALLSSGEVELPVYFVADNDYHAAQIRYVREHPGLLVLLSPGMHRTLSRITEESGELEEYRDLLIEEHGETARGWPERILRRPDRARVQRRLPLDGVLCRRSLGVLVSADRAEMLRKRHPDIPVTELPDLENPERVAKAILSAAAEVLANPRAIDPLPPGDWPSVEVLIVAYNCKRIVRPVLESIAAQDYPNLRCTLVDNSSSDGTGAFVRESFPFVNVVTCSENLGFAGGNNVVLEHSDAKYVVLLNQDAVARPDFVRELVRAAERDETIAAVGGKILMLRCPTIFNSTGILVNEGGFAVDRQIGEKDEDPSPVPENVFGACGGAQLVRSSVIRRIGGFDESFFMYYEDVDLCWRMRLAGLRVLYAPLAVVLHDWFGDLDDDSEVKSASEVDAKTRRRTYLCERNRLQCVLKNLQLGHLVRVLKRLWKYDKGRLELIRKEIAGCYDTDSAGITGRAIRSAWTWNLRHAFSIFLRRRRVQKWRVVSDEAMREFVAEGVVELSDRCDLHVLHDRHCAKASPRLVVGINDQKALGPGWYAREPVADQKWDLRWSNGRAWLYVEAVREAHTLKIRLARGPFETKLRVILGRQDLGSRPIEQEGMHVIAFTLPRPQPVQKQIEVRLESNTFQLSKLHDGADHRVLGVQVAELWLE